MTGSGDPLFGDGSRASMAMSTTAPPREAKPAATRPVTVGTATVRTRRARVTVKRIDPWSTLKFSFIYGAAAAVVFVVAVVILYALVDALGVIGSLRSFFDATDTSDGGAAAWLGFGRILFVAIIMGAINVVLFTAFATLTAFIYNVSAEIGGGVEVTLAERQQ